MLSAKCQLLILRCLRAASRRGRRRWLRRSWLFPCSAFLFIRCQNQVQRIAFLPWTELHQTFLVDVLDQTLQNLAAQALPRHFASPEEDGRFHLVSFVEEAQYMILLGFVVVIVHVDTKLHFFDRNGLLLFLGFPLALFVLVQEFPIIHDAANRRLRGRGNFHQVQVSFAGHLERLEGRHHANLFPFVTDHANFARPDALVHADKTFVDTVLRLLNLTGKMLKKYSMRSSVETEACPAS